MMTLGMTAAVGGSWAFIIALAAAFVSIGWLLGHAFKESVDLEELRDGAYDEGFIRGHGVGYEFGKNTWSEIARQAGQAEGRDAADAELFDEGFGVGHERGYELALEDNNLFVPVNLENPYLVGMIAPVPALDPACPSDGTAYLPQCVEEVFAL